MSAILSDDDLAGLVDTGDLIAAVRVVHVDQALGRADQPVPVLAATGLDTVLLPMIATSHRLGLTALARAARPKVREVPRPVRRSTTVSTLVMRPWRLICAPNLAFYEPNLQVDGVPFAVSAVHAKIRRDGYRA